MIWRGSFGLAFLGGAILSAGTTLAQICDEPFSRPSYPTRQAFCQVGQLVDDAYAPGVQILCEEMEVDHLVSLRQAWASGVCGEDLRRLARDPRNLRQTYWLTNRRKGSLTPEEFATRLPDPIAARVIQDANALMQDYGILPREAALLRRMRQISERTGTHPRIPLVDPTRRPPPRITTRAVAGRALGYVSRKFAMIPFGPTGWVYDGYFLTSWAARKISTPRQTEEMFARSQMLGRIITGER